MAFPVTLNGRTYTLTDFEGTNYVDGLPDAFEDFVTHAGDIYNSTSTTSNSIGTGSKTFTVEANKPYQAGTPLRIADAAAPSTNFLDTVVTSYSGTTLVVNSIGFGGSGTKTSWTVNIGGAKTVDGTLGLSQGGTGATDAAGARTNIDVYSKADADSRFLNVSGEASDVTMNGNTTIGDSSTDTLTVRATTTFTNIGTGAAAGPYVNLFRDSSSAADDDFIGIISWNGKNDADQTITYGQIAGRIADASDGSEDARMDLQVIVAGTTRSIMQYESGLTQFNAAGQDIDFKVHSTGNSNMLFVDAENNRVGIGTNSPNNIIETHLSDSTAYNKTGSAATDAALRILNDSSTTGAYSALKLDSKNATGTVGQWAIASISTSSNYDNDLAFHTRTGSSTYEERMRIYSSGSVGTGASTTAYSRLQVNVDHTPVATSTTAGDYLSDGVYVNFVGSNNDAYGTKSVGGIYSRWKTPATENWAGIDFTDRRTSSSGGHRSGLVFRTRNGGSGDRAVVEINQSGTLFPSLDNAVNLGGSSNRWATIYAGTGSINTSDENAKQQIAELTASELAAAKAISGLFKTFKFNDAVAEKGDSARTHSGVIAQQVQQVLTDNGLDASDYAFFIRAVHYTKQETRTLSDGSTEELKHEWEYNEDDIPDDAVEHVQLGIRYAELLSFIGAATEQRLASIETRITALEG